MTLNEQIMQFAGLGEVGATAGTDQARRSWPPC